MKGPVLSLISGGFAISWAIKKRIKERLKLERGTVYKDPGGRLRVCLVYPNTYSLGMTNLGFQSVYRLLNASERVVCERAFLPDPSELEEHVRTETPLLSYESATPVAGFDVIAFSVAFEEDYMFIPGVLNLCRVPVEREGRKKGPLVAAGGVAVSLNPEPLSDLIDLFFIGEAEGALTEAVELYKDLLEKGSSKDEALKALDGFEWTYIPSFYSFSFDGPRITGIEAAPGGKKKVRASKRLDLTGFEAPRSFVYTPATEFRETYCIEVERGCGRGCRFCAAGFLYLPPRMRDFNEIKRAMKEGIEATGKIGLVGTAVSEYPEIKDTVRLGIEEEAGVTLSSLRLDNLDPEFLAILKQGGYRTITLAPEAGTERMRNIVNKGITGESIMESIRLIKEAGFNRLKLYFLVGLPFEEDSDAEGIVELTRRIKAVLPAGEVALSVNPFIPKPNTPFQWERFEDIDVIERRLKIIKKGLSREGGVVVKEMSAREAFIQAYVSRADRRAGKVIKEAWSNGWKRAVKGAGSLVDDSVYSRRSREEIFPWDVIDHGVKKAYLWKEYEKAARGALTPPCDVGKCFRCGVC